MSRKGIAEVVHLPLKKLTDRDDPRRVAGRQVGADRDDPRRLETTRRRRVATMHANDEFKHK